MFSGKTIFSQVVELIHPQQFRRCVVRYRGDYKVKAFSCWDQLLCTAFAQLTFRESLRDIEDCLKARSYFHAHAAQSGMGGLEAIQGNYSRLAVALESFTEEGLGGGDVTRSTEVGFDGFALFINSAVEVHPLTAYLEVGLVHAPGIADRPLIGLPAFLELWDVTYDPAQDLCSGRR